MAIQWVVLCDPLLKSSCICLYELYCRVCSNMSVFCYPRGCALVPSQTLQCGMQHSARCYSILTCDSACVLFQGVVINVRSVFAVFKQEAGKF